MTKQEKFFPGKSTCVRCHFIHDDDKAIEPKTLPLDTKADLRDLNDKDQMCYNCHSMRTQTTSQANGSHPVSINYSSAWRANPTKYASYAQYTSSMYRVPRNANPTNPTSQLASYYKDGKIVCTTCHGVHYSDSNSTTFDNRSTANGGNATYGESVIAGKNFAHSNGDLLRTDRYGSNADAVNICTNCHKDGRLTDKPGTNSSKTRAHNNSVYGINQNVQCVDCHGAHVDEVDGTLNQKLILRTMTYSSSYKNLRGKGVKVSFTNGAMNYANPDGTTGICQVCHTVPGPEVVNPRNGSNYPEAHRITVAATATECAGCHPHNATTGGFSFDPRGCSQCHGYPPPQKAVQLTLYTTSETATAHRTHSAGLAAASNRDTTKYAYDCIECHYSGMDSDRHAKGTPKDVFNPAVGPISMTLGSNPTYDANARTCNTTYCHSNGGPADATPIYRPSPDWKNGKTNCTSCHDTGSSLVTGSHAKHVTVGYTCNQCHKTTVNGTNVIIGRSLHANGTKNLSFVVTGSFNKVGNQVTCTNTCHYNAYTGANAQAIWGDAASGACGTCHQTFTSTGNIATNAHAQHLVAGTGAVGPELGYTINACQVCHNYSTTTNHVNGSKDLNGSCAACHPNGTTVWSNSDSVTCRSCHIGNPSVINLTSMGFGIYTAPTMNNFTTLGHGQSFGTIGKIDCNGCHDGSSRHIRTATNHRLTGTEQSICSSCHNQDWVVNSVVRTAKVTKTHVRFGETAESPTEACSACHDPHGSSNKRMVKAKITFHAMSAPYSVAFTNATSGFVQTVYPYRGLCQICHTLTGHFKRGQAPDTHGTGENRKCLKCHLHQPDDSKSQMAFAPANGDCNSCHGYPPAKSMVGLGVQNNYSTALIDTYADSYAGGGAHTVAGHVPKNATSKALNGNCTNCHSQFPTNHYANGSIVVQANVQVVIDPKFTFQPGIAPAYNKTTNTCSNVSCHYAPTPTW
jgi:predicted CxxxxCH...CXXCH cytochrome family protein